MTEDTGIGKAVEKSSQAKKDARKTREHPEFYLTFSEFHARFFLRSPVPARIPVIASRELNPGVSP